MGVAPPSPVALDDWRAIGLHRAFARTIVASVRAPNAFYAAVAQSTSSLVLPVAYSVVFDLVVATLTLLYQKALGEDELRATLIPFLPQLGSVIHDAPETLDRFVRIASFGSFAIAPLSGLLELLTTTTVTWIGVRLTLGRATNAAPRGPSFTVLLRVFAYASWVRLFGVIGVTGDLVLSSLSALVTIVVASLTWFIAVRASQGLDNRQTILASLWAGVAALALGCFVGLPMIVGLVLWIASKVELPTLSP